MMRLVDNVPLLSRCVMIKSAESVKSLALPLFWPAKLLAVVVVLALASALFLEAFSFNEAQNL